MRVRIERHGGFSGRPAVGERDEAALTPAQRAALRQLLAAPPSGQPSPGADRFHYKVRIEDSTGTHELTVHEDDMPEDLAEIPQIEL